MSWPKIGLDCFFLPLIFFLLAIITRGQTVTHIELFSLKEKSDFFVGIAITSTCKNCPSKEIVEEKTRESYNKNKHKNIFIKVFITFVKTFIFFVKFL